VGNFKRCPKIEFVYLQKVLFQISII